MVFCEAITSTKINTALSENNVHIVEKFILIMISNLMSFVMNLIVFKVLKTYCHFFYIKQSCVIDVQVPTGERCKISLKKGGHSAWAQKKKKKKKRSFLM